MERSGIGCRCGRRATLFGVANPLSPPSAPVQNPLSPPSAPVQRWLQGPPAKSKFLAAIETAPGEFRAAWDSGDEKRHRRSIRFGKLTLKN